MNLPTSMTTGLIGQPTETSDLSQLAIGMQQLLIEGHYKVIRSLERELVLMQLMALEERDNGGFTTH